MSDKSKEITKLLADLDVPFTASKVAGADEVTDWKLAWPSIAPNHGDYEIRIRLHDNRVFILYSEELPDHLKENAQFYIGLLRLNGEGGEQKIALAGSNKIVVWASISDTMISPPFFNQMIAAVAVASEEVIKLLEENRAA